MDKLSLLQALAGLNIPELRYHETISSTSDAAAEWAEAGAGDRSLVVANSQTAGRGRLNRSWVTVPGSSLAFSLILLPSDREALKPTLFTALGALAICEALNIELGFTDGQVKWPNDVLIGNRKVAGILAESNWIGNRVKYVILGIGINISRGSIPPPDQLQFPASCIEESLQKSVDRHRFLASVIHNINNLRLKMLEPTFIETWNQRLAFRNSIVNIEQGGAAITGHLIRVDHDGNLWLRDLQGKEISVSYGDVRLRPAAG